MNRLLIRLWGVLEDEDQESINYQIASTLVKNIASIKHTSSAALADFYNVSKPSISRFCKNLGYEDFYDFRAELNQYCPDRGLKYQLPQRGDRSQWMEGVDAVLNCKTGSNLAGSNICLEMAANLIAYCYWNLYQ